MRTIVPVEDETRTLKPGDEVFLKAIVVAVDSRVDAVRIAIDADSTMPSRLLFRHKLYVDATQSVSREDHP